MKLSLYFAWENFLCFAPSDVLDVFDCICFCEFLLIYYHKKIILPISSVLLLDIPKEDPG